MKTGKVKWFNNAKGYGFILADDSNEDLFAHYSTIEMDGYRTLKAGQRVQFETKPSDKGTHAINIRAIDANPDGEAAPSGAETEQA
jgi:CspA family cold shock protein